jgi:DNA-binding NtrC family response regulator
VEPRNALPLNDLSLSADCGTGANLSPQPPVRLPESWDIPHLQTPTTLLAVSDQEDDLHLLEQTFRGTNWRLSKAKSYREAMAILCRDRMPVVICRCCLPDGNWKDILSQIAELPDAPRLIVASGEPDLCAEVINLGGYDLLTTPLDQHEVIRAVGCAWRNWESEFGGAHKRWKEGRFLAQRG